MFVYPLITTPIFYNIMSSLYNMAIYRNVVLGEDYRHKLYTNSLIAVVKRAFSHEQSFSLLLVVSILLYHYFESDIGKRLGVPDIISTQYQYLLGFLLMIFFVYLATASTFKAVHYSIGRDDAAKAWGMLSAKFRFYSLFSTVFKILLTFGWSWIWVLFLARILELVLAGPYPILGFLVGYVVPCILTYMWLKRFFSVLDANVYLYISNGAVTKSDRV